MANSKKTQKKKVSNKGSFSFTGKIIDIKRDVFHSTQEPFLDVTVEILNEDGEVVDTKKLGYPADTTEEAIKADLEKVIHAFATDVAIHESTKEAEALNAKADETAESMIDMEIEQARPVDSHFLDSETKKGKK